MKCINHPEKEPVATCTLCGRGVCEECTVLLDDKSYCKKCLREKIVEPNPAGAAVSREKKKRFWAFIFSLIPGVGYMYLGLMNRGLQTTALFFGSAFISSFIGFEEVMALIAPVIMFYSIFDTQQLVKNINQGISVEDKQIFDIKKIPITQAWLGYTLVVIGLLALIQNVLPSYFPLWMALRRVLPPFIIIALGVSILYRNTREKPRENDD